MNRLPNAHLAVVDERKISAYLLSESHPAGRAKAAFFRRYGFRMSSWEALRDALLAHGRTAEVASTTETKFGTKYILEGTLAAPDGRSPRLRTVWFVTVGEVHPQLVTAYPALGDEK
jgi:hypothetical protein